MKKLAWASAITAMFSLISLSVFAEISILAEITGFDGKKTYEVFSTAGYEKREAYTKKQNKYFSKATDLARDDWITRGKVFYNSGIQRPVIRQVRRFTEKAAAQGQKQHFTKLEAQPKKVGTPIGGGKKGKKSSKSSKWLPKKDPKKEAARKKLEADSLSHFRKKLKKLMDEDALGLSRNSSIDFAN